MPRFVALLRGINVGKARRIPMKELRALFAEQGLDTVTLRNLRTVRALLGCLDASAVASA